MAQSHEYLTIEYSEEEVWLTWTDRNNEHQEKSVRQLAQEARAGNAHDENVLSYYRCLALAVGPRRRPLPGSSRAVRSLLSVPCPPSLALHKAFLHTRTVLRPRLTTAARPFKEAALPCL